MRFFVAVGDPQAVPGPCVAAAPSLLQAGRGMPSSPCHTPAMPPILATQTEAKNTQKYLPSPLQSLSLQQEGEPSPWRPKMPPKMQKKKGNGEQAMDFAQFAQAFFGKTSGVSHLQL